MEKEKIKEEKIYESPIIYKYQIELEKFLASSGMMRVESKTESGAKQEVFKDEVYVIGNDIEF